MATIGLSLTANVVSAFIGKQILGQAISDASGKIYGSISSIFNYNSKIDDIIKQLDIYERIKTIDLLIKDIDECNDTITNCLTGIHEIILNIREDLKQIDVRIKDHKQKYFAGWRKISCNTQLKSLRTNSILLEKRFDYLLKALEINKYNVVKKPKTENLLTNN